MCVGLYCVGLLVCKIAESDRGNASLMFLRLLQLEKRKRVVSEQDSNYGYKEIKINVVI